MLDFKADIVKVVNAVSKIDEIIYNPKVMTVNSNVVFPKTQMLTVYLTTGNISSCPRSLPDPFASLLHTI